VLRFVVEAQPERLAVGVERVARRAFALDHQHLLRPARCRLEAERAAAGKQIKAAQTAHILSQPVEQRFAHAIRCRPEGLLRRKGDEAAAPCAADHAHAVALHRRAPISAA